jgi:phosphoribosylanthranilate isomerase
MTLIKICGIRETEHAMAASHAGADLIGFVFVPVRREVKPEVARDILSSVRQTVDIPPVGIGLFVNERAQTINRIADEVGLDLVQLHGDEAPELAAEIDVPVIKAIRLERDLAVSDVRRTIESYLEHCAGVLIDSHVPGHWGGTGVVGDWNVVSELARDYPIVLAGGLTPENVAEAINTVGPAIVDVSSGVETDGRKDSAKIARFITQARSVDREDGISSASQSLATMIKQIRYSRASRVAGQDQPGTNRGVRV